MKYFTWATVICLILLLAGSYYGKNLWFLAMGFTVYFAGAIIWLKEKI